MDADGSVFSCYKVAASLGSSRLSITDMEFKPAQASSTKPAKGLLATKQAVSSLAYTVQWQLAGQSSSAAASKAAIYRKTGVLLGTSSKTAAIIPGGVSGSARMLQQLQNLPPRAATHLRTYNVQAGRNNGPSRAFTAPSCTAATGLMRVAMQESPFSSFKHLDISGNSPISTADGSLAGLEGVLDQGCRLQPILTESTMTRQEPCALKQASSVLITGGLGDLGQTVASWMSVEYPEGQIWLLGRSGRSKLRAELMLSHAPVTSIACDAASASDVGSLKVKPHNVSRHLHICTFANGSFESIHI